MLRFVQYDQYYHANRLITAKVGLIGSPTVPRLTPRSLPGRS
jgi:hypothetical protein